MFCLQCAAEKKKCWIFHYPLHCFLPPLPLAEALGAFGALTLGAVAVVAVEVSVEAAVW